MPRKLYDYTIYENKIEDLVKLETKKSDYVYSKVYCDNLLVVYTGNQLKYIFLDKNPSKQNKRSNGELDYVFKKTGNAKNMFNMHAHFSKSVEILNVIETLV